ncbi:unnamed protein product [Schistosoma turkestanicum]|nr:unnamed protein product [Schistosoma turkestanicum]
MSGVRRRNLKTIQDDGSSAVEFSKHACDDNSEDTISDKFTGRPYNLLFWLGSLATFFLAYIIICDDSSDCWHCSDSSCSTSFDVVSARSHLTKVTSFGPRTAGSLANEVAAADYLRNELKSISSVANKADLLVLYDEHVSTYSSFRAFFHTSSYNNVRNFVLRFHDMRAKNGNQSKSAFLINCHYDTAPGSPGASDAFVNCAVMLEVCRILATGAFTLFNDLIFLFNGAEESLLLSSHAFITQHKWAADVVAFMNLEGAGSAKRHLLFQTGPGHSSDILLEAYKRSFKQPFASVLGEDVFQFGLVPSDTDYRIFRDYGRVPGLDLAYMQDAYVYHTPYDTESRISDRCLQLSGDNILRYLRHIPDSPEVTEKESHMLVVPIDVNGIRYLTPNSYPVSALRLFMNPEEHMQLNYKGIKELVEAKPVECNYSQPYCGVASVYPLLHVLKHIYRVPAEFHKIKPNVGLKLLSRTLLTDYLPNGRLGCNVTFSVVSGPPHTHILIRTDGNHTKLTEWSFTSTALYPSSMPLPPSLKEIPSNKGEHYFLYHLNAAAFGNHGVLWETPWTFWVVFELQDILPQSSYIDIAAAGLYIDEEVFTRSSPLLDFISRLPPWVTVTQGCAVYDHWRFQLN